MFVRPLVRKIVNSMEFTSFLVKDGFKVVFEEEGF